jgi:hypothetical protein
LGGGARRLQSAAVKNPTPYKIRDGNELTTHKWFNKDIYAVCRQVKPRTRLGCELGLGWKRHRWCVNVTKARTARSDTQVESVAAPQAARGCARPPFRHFKNQFLLLPGSAFGWAKPFLCIQSKPRSAIAPRLTTSNHPASV